MLNVSLEEVAVTPDNGVTATDCAAFVVLDKTDSREIEDSKSGAVVRRSGGSGEGRQRSLVAVVALYDYDRTMREPVEGEQVIHCLDSVLVGRSVVAAPCT